MLTSGNGIYRGSLDDIMDNHRANQSFYTMKVAGQTVDTRKGMTWEMYQAFINQAKAGGVNPLPHSAALAKLN